METKNWKEYPNIIKKIIGNSTDYEFHQIMTIFDNQFKSNMPLSDSFNKKIKLRPAAEISFPASDVRRCKVTSNGKLDLQMNFMGLYGSDSPVPHYFLESIASDSEESKGLRAFIDIFCHRYYFQFHQVWKKYRPYVDVENSDLLYYLKSFSGNTVSSDAESEYSFSHTLGMRVRNSILLGNILSEYLNDADVSIDEFSPRWVNVEPEAIGRAGAPNGLSLGDNSILGNRILDLGGKISVCIGPTSVDIAKKLLPGNDFSKKFMNILNQYLEPTITYDLVIEVEPSNKFSSKLGTDEMILGWSCWLGNKIESTSIFKLSKESLGFNCNPH
jgi:type VI secretion system protein ImpH